MQYDQVRAVLKMWLRAVLAVLVVAPTIAFAYPTKPVMLIVPFGAGSAPDTTMRILAEQAGKDLGQQLVILNRPGAGGTIGVRAVVQAAPDGYTIGMAAVAVLTLQLLRQDARQDVRASARRVRHDDFDRAGRIVLRMRSRRLA